MFKAENKNKEELLKAEIIKAVKAKPKEHNLRLSSTDNPESAMFKTGG